MRNFCVTNTSTLILLDTTTIISSQNGSCLTIFVWENERQKMFFFSHPTLAFKAKRGFFCPISRIPQLISSQIKLTTKMRVARGPFDLCYLISDAFLIFLIFLAKEGSYEKDIQTHSVLKSTKMSYSFFLFLHFPTIFVF